MRARYEKNGSGYILKAKYANIRYQKLEYVESTGTQYVDINYTCLTNNISIELDMMWTGTDVSKFETFIGFMKASNVVTPRIGLHKYTGKFMFGANTTTTSGTTPPSTRFTYKGDFTSGNQKLYYNGSQIVTSSTTYSFSGNTCPTYIFARYCPNSMNYAYMRLYGCKIWEGSTLVKHLIPVKQLSTQKIGVYDIINDEFYSSGSGTELVASTTTTGYIADTSRMKISTTLLPSTYQPVEYIEGTENQYIEIDFSPTANTRVEYKIQTSSSQTVASAPIIGTRVGTGNTNRFFPIAYSGTTAGRMTFGDKEYTWTFNANIPYIGVFDAKNQTSTLNGQTYSLTGNAFAKAESTNMCIFGTNGYGANHYIAKARLYYCKIYENDNLVRNLVPCYRISGTVIGLFDTITQTFYTATGSGTLNKGSNKSNII